jgi:hypothetical protein
MPALRCVASAMSMRQTRAQTPLEKMVMEYGSGPPLPDLASFKFQRIDVRRGIWNANNDHMLQLAALIPEHPWHKFVRELNPTLFEGGNPTALSRTSSARAYHPRMDGRPAGKYARTEYHPYYLREYGYSEDEDINDLFKTIVQPLDLHGITPIRPSAEAFDPATVERFNRRNWRSHRPPE